MINPISQGSGVPSLTPPASMIPNSFPRKYISSTENILFETKPFFSGFFLTGKGIAYLVFLVFIFLIDAIMIIYVPEFLIGGIMVILIFLILLFFIPIAIMSLVYKNTYYAMTDSRILVAQGILNKNLISVTYDMITSIDIQQPWLMSKITNLGFIRFEIPSLRNGAVMWSFIKQPAETYRFILDVKNIYAAAGAVAATYLQANIFGNVVAANISNQKRCVKCGAYINASAKFCPKCGAKQP